VRFDKAYAQTYFNASVGSILPEAPPEGRKTTHSRRCRFRAREPAKTALKTHYLLPPLI